MISDLCILAFLSIRISRARIFSERLWRRARWTTRVSAHRVWIFIYHMHHSYMNIRELSRDIVTEYSRIYFLLSYLCEENRVLSRHIYIDSEEREDIALSSLVEDSVYILSHRSQRWEIRWDMYLLWSDCIYIREREKNIFCRAPIAHRL